jgi:hypothetical protein
MRSAPQHSCSNQQLVAAPSLPCCFSHSSRLQASGYRYVPCSCTLCPVGCDAVWQALKAALLTVYIHVPQHHSTTAPQHHSTTAPQHHSTTAPQHHSTTAPQHHSTTAPQHHSTTAPHADCHNIVHHTTSRNDRSIRTALITLLHASQQSTTCINTSPQGTMAYGLMWAGPRHMWQHMHGHNSCHHVVA